jgi:hypothetical protein
MMISQMIVYMMISLRSSVSSGLLMQSRTQRIPMSKGSTQRPTDKSQFDLNYDRIFGRKEENKDGTNRSTPEREQQGGT